MSSVVVSWYRASSPVSSVRSGSSDLHIKSGTLHRLANGDTLRKTRHLYPVYVLLLYGRLRRAVSDTERQITIY
jgi:hypothetical protein